jgi:hypothetical protein
MSRAGGATLDRIADLLGDLRERSVLRERSPGVFDLGPRHFLHFHDAPEGIVADVFLADGRIRMPVETASERADLLEVVDRRLEAIKARTPRRDPERGRRGGRRSRRDS